MHIKITVTQNTLWQILHLHDQTTATKARSQRQDGCACRDLLARADGMRDNWCHTDAFDFRSGDSD